MKRTIIHSILSLLIISLSLSCSKVRPGKDNAIRLAPVISDGYLNTKASIFTESELPTNDDDFYFCVEAFLTDNNGDNIKDVWPYFTSEVRYLYIYNDQDQIAEWSFSEKSGENITWKDYYFPLDASIDMFAYVPQSYVTIVKDNNGKITSNPPQFTADLPQDNTNNVNQNNIYEFMYAYTPVQSKADPEVTLAFEHPFAAVKFVVGQSHRDLTIRSMGFNNINIRGTCTVTYDESTSRYLPSWSEVSTGNMSFAIGKIIPGDINFGGPVGETYIVLPQDFSDTEKMFTISYHWYDNDNDTSDDEYTKTINMSTISPEGWKAGYIYTYSLNLGNSAEEILFDVNVEPWNTTYDYTFELK